MRIRRAIAAYCVFLGTSGLPTFAQAESPSHPEFNEILGTVIITGEKKQGCLATEAKGLKINSVVPVILFGDGTPAKVDHATIEAMGCNLDLPPKNTSDLSKVVDYALSELEHRSSLYRVTLAGGGQLENGIAVISPQAKIHSKSPLEIDVNGDGADETLSLCYTGEGARLSVRATSANGKPLGAPLWSDYIYVGYDLESTCPPDAE